MKLLLISPTRSVGRKTPMGVKVPQLALHILASLTPNDVDITVVDEETTDIDFSMDFDLVGISCMTATANRGYQLCDIFREKGARVVLGGVHPTVLPQEAIQHADAVVIGEAEGCWANVIDDFRKGSLKKFYHVPAPDLSKYPLPRRDLQIDRSLFRIPILGLVATRGCPYACEFCSVTDLYGRRIRHRPIPMVIEDIKRSGSRIFALLDDNAIADRGYAKQLFIALAELNIIWGGQSSIGLAKDKELLELCQKSGCKGLFFGLESVSPASLRRMKKSLKSIEEMEEAIKIIRDHGIIFHPSFVFGFDTDTEAIFDDTLEFMSRNRISTAVFNVLTPYPGTRLYERFKEQGRILSYDWSHYNNATVVFRPKNMTPSELAEGYYHVKKEFYSLSSMLRHLTFLLQVSHLCWAQMVFSFLNNLAGRIFLKETDRSRGGLEISQNGTPRELPIN